MNLRYVTCSDPREDVKINDIIRLLRYAPQVEIGVQAHPTAMSDGMPRNIWFKNLMTLIINIDMPLNVAVHVNYGWCDKMCRGILPAEIESWMKLTRSGTNTPAIKRWQLNIGDGTSYFEPDAVAKLIHDHPENEFIFPYNDGSREKIEKLHQTGAAFSLLYDSSYGYGVTPDRWNPPVYETHPMGYAGGLSPDNVATHLQKISKQVPQNYDTWIDAEGRLMVPNTRKFDISRAMTYAEKALNWIDNQKKR